jgi:hypothetical protein
MAYFNEKEAHIFLEMMEGLPSQEIAAENGLTFEELMECKDIIIDKLNQDIRSINKLDLASSTLCRRDIIN